MNDLKGRSYCFTQDKVNTIDAIYVGNLMRFANHACDALANCHIKIVFAQGMQRVCLVAKRNIEEGEELYFDYHFSKEFEWLNEYNNRYTNSLL